MQVFAVILLAAVAAATSIADNHQPKIGLAEASRLFKVYAAPASEREYVLQTDVEGMKALFNKTIIVAYKNDKEINGFFLKGGFTDLPKNADATPFLQKLLSGEEKIGVTLSGMKFLNMPEINLPFKSLVLPSQFNLRVLLRQYQDEPLIPVLFVTTRQEIPSLSKLREMGEITVKPDSTQISREFPIAMDAKASRIARGCKLNFGK